MDLVNKEDSEEINDYVEFVPDSNVEQENEPDTENEIVTTIMKSDIP